MNIEMEIKKLEIAKEICHTIYHRMTFFQLLIYGGWHRKQYDKYCNRIAELRKGETK